MTKKVKLKVTIQTTHSNNPLNGWAVEAWDHDKILIDNFLDKGLTDSNGHCELAFDPSRYKEYFLDRHPYVYFKIYHGDRMRRERMECG